MGKSERELGWRNVGTSMGGPLGSRVSQDVGGTRG